MSVIVVTVRGRNVSRQPSNVAAPGCFEFDDHRGRLHTLWICAPTIHLGRGEDNDIVIQDSSTSRLHAAIDIIDNGAVRVRDLGSTNGTYVNGVRRDWAVLKANDRVKVGRLTLRLGKWPGAG